MQKMSFLSDAVSDPWGSVVATWQYLMGMPLPAAIGLSGATLVLLIAAAVIAVIKRPDIGTSAFLMPLAMVGVAWIASALNGNETSGFLTGVVKFFTFIGFLWSIVVVSMALVAPKKVVKKG